MGTKDYRKKSTLAYLFDDIEANYALPDPVIKSFVEKQKHRYEEDAKQPWKFLENDKEYRVCFGIVHIKSMILFLTTVKTCFVLWFVVSRVILQEHYAIFALTSIFGISLILSSYAFLIIGVTVKKDKLLIPYFTLTLFLILILMMKLFIDVLGTANTKDTLEINKLQLISGEAIVISIEIYSVFLVWKSFNYITDYHMEKDYLRNVKVAQQRKMWEMEYTKGFDAFVKEMGKEKMEELARKSPIGSEASAEPYLQKLSRPSIHKSSQHSSTTTSD